MKRGVPYVEISQQTECGLGCICMLLRYYHRYITMTELREHSDVGRDGSSLRQISTLMKEYDLNVKVYQNSVDNLIKIPAPTILFWENSHYVILDKVKHGHYYIADPALGYRRLNYEEMRNSYSNIFIVATPNENFKKEKSNYKNSCEFFLPVFSKQKALYFKIAILSLLMYVSTLVVPIFIQDIIDSVKDGRIENFNVINILLLFSTISLVYLGVFWLRGRNILNLRVSVEQKLNEKLYHHLLLLPFKFFEIRGKGNIIYNLNNTATIRELLTNQLITGIIDCGAVIFITFYMFIKSPILCSIAILLFIVNIIILKISYPYLLQNNKALILEQSRTQATQMEAVYSILGIKMTSLEDITFCLWREIFQKYLHTYTKKENYNLKINAFLSFLIYVSPIMILCGGIILTKIGRMTIGEAIAFYTLSGNFYALAHSVFNAWTSFMNSKAIFERLSDIFLEKPENINLEGYSKELEGNVELRNVSFKYTKSSEYVLKDINIKIPKGKKVSIVGKSGDGKSTLAKLLVGLYEPTKGGIFYDSVSLKDWNKQMLRKQIGIVPQDVTLFNKTIYENIVVDKNEQITMEKVRAVCAEAEILDEIESMPMTFNTIVSEMGMNLSGGQRQRIMLARALLNSPKFLILDEATSSLDNINQKEISKRLSHLKCSQVVIAHRLSTICDSDIIYVIDKGEIVESGNHEELLENKSVYYELYNNFRREDKI